MAFPSWMRKIPRGTAGGRYHAKPYWVGDSLLAIQRARSKATRYWRRRKHKSPRKAPAFIDINVQALADGVAALHWGNAAKNGYLFIAVKNIGKPNEVRRRMTRAELRRPMSKWTLAQVKRWRRTKRRGRTFATKVRPLSFLEAIRYCKSNNVTPCIELKSRLFATDASYAEQMVQQEIDAEWTVYYMTLSNMWGWSAKLKNVHEAGERLGAGGQTAILSRGKQPAGWPKRYPWVDATFSGPWRRI